VIESAKAVERERERREGKPGFVVESANPSRQQGTDYPKQGYEDPDYEHDPVALANGDDPKGYEQHEVNNSPQCDEATASSRQKGHHLVGCQSLLRLSKELCLLGCELLVGQNAFLMQFPKLF